MPVNYTSSELQFSGTVTNQEFYDATSTAGLSLDTDREIYVLGADIRLLSGCDLSSFGNLIIELDTHFVYTDAGVTDSTWRDVLFIESGARSVGDRDAFRGDARYRASGGGFVHNIRGGSTSGGGRLLTVVHATALDNVRIYATAFPVNEVDAVQFGGPAVVNNLQARRVKRIVCNGQTARVWFRNLVQTSRLYAAGGLFGLYNAGCAILENYSNTGIGTSTSDDWFDNYGSDEGQHYLYMAGTAAAYAEGESFSGGIQNRSNLLNIVGCGIRYYQFIGGEDAALQYWDSRSTSSPQRHVPTTDTQEMLTIATTVILGSDELATVMVRSWLANSSNSFNRGTGNVTDQEIRIWKFGKVITTVDCSDDPTAVIGTHESAAPVLLLDDELVTSAAAADVPDSAASSDDIYDMLHKHAVDNRSDIPGSVTAGLLDVGSRNVTLAASTATLAVSASSVTIPCDSTVERGSTVFGVRTSGTITVASGVTAVCDLIDSTGVTVTFTGLPHGSTDHDDHYNHHGVVRCWPQTQGADNRSNAVTGEVADAEATTISVKLAADTAYHYVVDALGYRRSSVGTLDTTTQRSIATNLEEIVDPQGNELIPHDLTTSEEAEADLIDWASDYITVDADGTNDAITYKALVYAVEQGQSTAAACGDLLHPARIEVGRVVFPSGSTQKWRAKATLTNTDAVPDLQSTGIGKDGAEDAEDFIDFTAGPLKYKAEAPVFATVEGSTETDIHAYLDTYEIEGSTFTLLDALRAGVAVMMGESSVSDSQVTFNRVDSAATPAVRVTVGSDAGVRTNTELL